MAIAASPAASPGVAPSQDREDQPKPQCAALPTPERPSTAARDQAINSPEQPDQRGADDHREQVDLGRAAGRQDRDVERRHQLHELGDPDSVPASPR